MRISTAGMHRASIGGILENQVKLAKTQTQIATGRKFQTASEDPIGATRVAGLRSKLADNAQYERNANILQSRLGYEEQTLADITSMLQSTRDSALAGANAFTGGTQVSGGVLRADSAKALGTGDVYVDTGTLMTQAAAPVAVVNYTQLATGALELHLGAANAGSLAAAGNVVIAGGTLTVKFQPGTVPRSGDTVVAIQAATLKGKFDKVVVEGFTATPTYTATGLQIRIN